MRKSLAKIVRTSFFLMGSFIGEACVLIGCHVSSSDCADTLLVTCRLLIVPTLCCYVSSLGWLMETFVVLLQSLQVGPMLVSCGSLDDDVLDVYTDILCIIILYLLQI